MAGQAHADLEGAKHFDTAGEVVLDQQGYFGGAGTHASAGCAISGTGWGKFYIRTVAAHTTFARVAYLKESPQQASEAVINQAIPRLGGDGGAIVLGADGAIGMPFNTEGMYRDRMGADDVAHVALYSSESLPPHSPAVARPAGGARPSPHKADRRCGPRAGAIGLPQGFLNGGRYEFDA